MEGLFALIPVVFVGLFVLTIVLSIRKSGYLARQRSGPGWNADLVARSSRGSRGSSDPFDCSALLTPVKTSPGQFLAVRLGPSDPPGAATAGCLLVFALFWCTITGVVGGGFLMQFLQGTESPWWILFFVPFVLIGLGLLYAALRQIVLAMRVPVALVEMEKEPVCPGDVVRLQVTQPGNFALNNYTVDLQCVEHVTYTQGTDTRHEERVVISERLHETGAREVSTLRPLDDQVTVRVPAGAPASFHAAHNDLTWRIVVAADIRRWPNPTWHFPFRVVPPVVRGRL